ncbi:MAG: hypothetical protein II956_06340 [Bacteroidales bacterium]|nr:hypothetical protein [Bacteroidales bacterium]
MLPVVGVVMAGMTVVECIAETMPKDNYYKRRVEYLTQNADSLQLLVLGPSSTMMSVIPHLLDKKGYNASESSQPARMDYCLLKRFIDKMPKLEYVIFNFNASTLYSRQIVPGGDGEIQLYNYSVHYGADYYFMYKYYVMGGYKAIMSAFKGGDNDEKHMENDGFITYQPHKWTEAEKEEVHKKWTRHSDINDEGRFVDSIVNLCESRNIKLILLAPPITADYVDSRKPELDELRQVSEKYRGRKNIYLVDYLRPSFIVDSLDMRDWAHCNPNGARKVTLALNDSIRKWEGRCSN